MLAIGSIGRKPMLEAPASTDANLPISLGIPAMTVPAGLSEGLPVGLQVLAPARADAVVYKVAAIVEAATEPVSANCPARDWEEN